MKESPCSKNMLLPYARRWGWKFSYLFGHLGVKSIIRLGKAYEKYNLSWMEDVIPWTYTDLLKEISDRVPHPSSPETISI